MFKIFKTKFYLYIFIASILFFTSAESRIDIAKEFFQREFFY